jgi:glycosyltransferase involved in cell wall biosynthesis
VKAIDAISVVIPAYNAAPTIAETIQSVLRAASELETIGVGIEIIVVDDGSTDDTYDIVNTISDDRVRVICHRRNRGGAAARNTAVENATHEWLYCVDSDNVIDPKSVRRMVEMAATGDWDVVAPAETRYFEASPDKPTHSWIWDQSTVETADVLRMYETPVASGNYLYTVDMWARAGGYPEFAGSLDAWGFGLRLLFAGARFGVCADTFYLHRQGHASYYVRDDDGRRAVAAAQILLPYLPRLNAQDRRRLIGSSELLRYFSELPRQRLHLADPSVAFFDGLGAAHSLPVVQGLDDAAQHADMRRAWTSAVRPSGADDARCAWTKVPAYYEEYCETGRFPAVSYRRTLQAAVARAEASNAAFFCDLSVEHALGSYGLPIRADLPTVWILHQVPRTAGSGRALAGNPRKWRTEAELAHARGVLRHLNRSGGRFIVPSAAARDRLARIVSANRIRISSWPVVSASNPPKLAVPDAHETVVIFPGEARHSKGVDVLLAALPDMKGFDVLDIPTVVSTDVRARIAGADDTRIQTGRSWLSNEEYRRRLQRSSLAVLPYLRSAMANGGISASLLDVLSVGLPAVVTRPLARLLPPGYEGAIVVEPESADAIARGVTEALRDLDRLTAAAQEQGPAFVLANHSYEQYLDVIVAAGTEP